MDASSASWASSACSRGERESPKRASAATAVARRAAAERPKPAPMGREQAVFTRASTPILERRCSTGGEDSITSTTLPSRG